MIAIKLFKKKKSIIESAVAYFIIRDAPTNDTFEVGLKDAAWRAIKKKCEEEL